MKVCPTCREEKPIEDFTIRQSGPRTGQPVAFCKPCNARRSEQNRARRQPDHYRRFEWPSKLRRIYGITVAEYDAILERQGGGCAICKSRSSRGRTEMLPVDHDHATGKVRGILCTPCNRGLGLFNDDTEYLEAAIKYLKGQG